MTYRDKILAARADFGPDPPSFAVLDPRGEFLRGQGGNVTSQYGEDGLIAAVFEKIGTTNRWCFEVGAADGWELSNTKALRDDGWRGVLIEAAPEKYAEMQRRFQGTAVMFHEKIAPNGPRALDRVFDKVPCFPPAPDLGVIDIDGEDAAVFSALLCRPRVLLVEFNALGDGPWCLNGPWQAGEATVCRIGREKGYIPLCRTSCNLLFVAEEALGAHS
jgi:hypothetical protein